MSLQCIFHLLRTGGGDRNKISSQILDIWSVKNIASYLDELNGLSLVKVAAEGENTMMDEEERNELLVLVLKVIAQISEFTNSNIRNNNIDWSEILMKSVLECMRKRIAEKKNGEKIQQWGCNALFNLQHGSNKAKESFALLFGFRVVSDSIRQYRDSLDLNKLASALMVEVQFESVNEGATSLKFLPEVFAEALSSGVMTACSDMSKHFPDCPDISNCNRLLVSEYSKPRKTEIDVDHVEFVELN